MPACAAEVRRQRSLLAQPATRTSRQPRRSTRRPTWDADDSVEADTEPSPAADDADADVVPALGDQSQLTLSKLAVLEHTVMYVAELEARLAAAEAALHGGPHVASSSSGGSSLSSTPLVRSASIASLPPAGHPAYAPLDTSDGDAAATLLSFASPVEAMRPLRMNDELVALAPL